MSEDSFPLLRKVIEKFNLNHIIFSNIKSGGWSESFNFYTRLNRLEEVLANRNLDLNHCYSSNKFRKRKSLSQQNQKRIFASLVWYKKFKTIHMTVIKVLLPNTMRGHVSKPAKLKPHPLKLKLLPQVSEDDFMKREFHGSSAWFFFRKRTIFSLRAKSNIFSKKKWSKS